MLKLYTWNNQADKQSWTDLAINGFSRDIKNTLHQKDSAFALDFHTQSFWRIRIRELRINANPKDIESFFMDFDNAKDVILTVKDVDNPIITFNSWIKLELENKEKPQMLPVRVFWAFLPKEVKAPYLNAYNNEYERLIQLISDVTQKGIELESH